MLENEDEVDGGGAVLTPKRDEIQESSEDNEKKHSNKRLKNVEISVPIVYGTVAFWLGKKASEFQSHKWTVYVRGATNEHLGVVIKRVVFQLHPSFTNPRRVVESPPFELSECGWGEFEIAISIFFHSDACDQQLTLFHHLKLYAEEEFGLLSTRKPVVAECYDEIVFPDPSLAFFARVQNHPAVIVPRFPATSGLPLGKSPWCVMLYPLPLLEFFEALSLDLRLGSFAAPIEHVKEEMIGDTKDHLLSQWFINFSDADELLKLAAARQQVQSGIVKLRRRMVIEGVPQPLEPARVL